MFFDLNLLAALKHNSSLGYTEKARCVSCEVMNSLAWLHFSGNQFGIKSFDMEMLCSGSRMWDLICERPFLVYSGILINELENYQALLW